MRTISTALLLLLATACTEDPAGPAGRACTEHTECDVGAGEICLAGVCSISPVCPYKPCPAGTYCDERFGRCAIGELPDGGGPHPGEDAGNRDAGEGEGEGAAEGEGEGEGPAEGEGEGPAEGEGEGDRPPPSLGSDCSRSSDCEGGARDDLICKTLGNRRRCTYPCTTSALCGPDNCCYDTTRGAYCGEERLCRDPLVCDVDEDCAQGTVCFDRPDLGDGERRCHGPAGLGEPCVTAWDCNPDLADRCSWDPLTRRLYCTWACGVPDRPGDPGDCPPRTCCGDPIGLRVPDDYVCLLGSERCDLSLPCEQRDDLADSEGVPDDDCATPRRLPADGATAVLCGGDEDWYHVDVDVGQSAFFTMEWPEEEDVLDPSLVLRRLDCGFLSESAGRMCRPPAEDEELPRCSKTVSLKAPARGRYLVAVRGLPVGQELSAYRLDVRLGCLEHADCRVNPARGPSCERFEEEPGLCRDAFPCRDDDDCVGTRVCDQGTVQCIQPCQPDRFDREERNDDCGPRSTTVELPGGAGELSGLTICPADTDWFVVGLAQGDGMEATVDHVAAAGGLNVTIVAPSCLAEVATSADQGDQRRARLEAAAVGGNYYVRVRAGLNVQNDYDIRFSVRAGGFCIDDRSEEDDHPDLAHQVESLEPDGPDLAFEERKGCEDDDDWFRVPLLRGERLMAFLDSPVGQAEGDLDLELYGPGEPEPGVAPLAFANSREPGEQLTAAVPADGAYYLRVFGGLDAEYSLTLRREAAPCQDDEFEPNDVQEDARPIAVGTDEPVERDAHFCGGNADWWSVNLDVGEGIEATVCVADPDTADLVLGLYDPAGRVLERSDVPQAPCETVRLRPAPAAGDYGLRVSSPEGGESPYTLTVAVEEACADDAFEPNESNPNSRQLAPDTYALRRCGGNEDWFYVNKAEGATLWFDLVALPADPALRMTLYNRGVSILSDRAPVRPGQSAAASTDHPFGLNEPTYKLRVWSASAEAVFDYDLVVREVPPPGDCLDDDYEPDDSLVRAPERQAGEHAGRRICPGNVDHYPVQLQPGQSLAAELSFEHGDGDLSLVLLRPDGVTEEARSEGDGDSEFVALPTPAREAGRFLVRVEGARADVVNTYTLALTVQ